MTEVEAVEIWNPSLRRIDGTSRPERVNATFTIFLTHEGEDVGGMIETRVMTRITRGAGDCIDELEERARQQLRCDLLAIAAALE